MLFMAILTLTIFLSGILASAVYVARSGREDAPEIVVDEVAGQLLALAAAPRSMAGLIAAFLLFRLFDIVKPFPANWCDRNLKGGVGVMADDIVAGAYVFICMILGDEIAKSL